MVVEDEDLTAQVIEATLIDAGFAVLNAANSVKALELMKSQLPALMLLDVGLPGKSGFDFCRELRAGGHRFPIIMLTARLQEIDRVLGLELGADDYITKPFAARELISRIKAHLRRAYGSLSDSEATSQPEIRFGPYVIDRDRIRVLKEQTEIAVTPMEFKILVFLAEHEDQVFSRQQILQQMWDNAGYFGDERAVDVHIHHLRLKLEDDANRPQYLKTVRGFGYSFVKKP